MADANERSGTISAHRMNMAVRTALSILMFLSSFAHGEESEPTVESEPIANRFLLMQKAGGLCLTIKPAPPESESCIYKDPENGEQCYPSSQAVLEVCEEGRGGQRWLYNFPKKQIYFSGYPSELCLSRMVNGLEMQVCEDGLVAQKWRFDSEGELISLADQQIEGDYLKLLQDESEVRDPLLFKYLGSDMGEERCFKDPVAGKVVCGQQEPTQEDPPNVEPTPPPELTAEWGDRPEEFWVSEKLTEDLNLVYPVVRSCLSLKLSEQCLSGSMQGAECFSGIQVEMDYCKGNDAQVWRHDLKKKRLFNKLAGYGYCLTWKGQQLKLQGCFAGGAPSQQWYFARGKTEASPERGRLRTVVGGLKTPYQYLDDIEFSDDLGVRRGRLRILYEAVSGSGSVCGYHPVTGAWQGVCAIPESTGQGPSQ